MQLAILDRIGLLQNRIRPILPLKPVRRFGDPHHVSGHFGIEMGGDRNTRSTGDGSRSLPACDAANPHEIRHDIIAGFHLQGGVERAWSVEILTELDRRLQIGGQPRVTLEVVLDDGLLDPGEAEIIDRVASFQRLAKVKSLVEIDHQAHLAPDTLSDGLDRRDIIGNTLTAETQL